MDNQRQENNYDAPAPDLAGKLEAAFSLIENPEEMRSSLEQGKNEFNNDIRDLGLESENTSVMHGTGEVDIQAFTCSLTSRGKPQEIVDKSYITHGTHWLDDYIDIPELVIDAKRMVDERHDIVLVLKGMGKVGEIGFKCIERTHKKDLAMKGMHRMFYGGITHRSQERGQRDLFLDEYMELSLAGIDADLAREIRTVQKQAYLATNSVIFEFINGPETDLDINVQELWNLIYAPIIHLRNSEEEKKAGTTFFTDEEKPKTEEFIKMISVAGKYASVFKDPRIVSRIEQLGFVIKAFGRELKDVSILEAYKSLYMNLNK